VARRAGVETTRRTHDHDSHVMDDSDRPDHPERDRAASTDVEGDGAPGRPDEPRRTTATGPLLWYGRADIEFSRATAFFDATYALATTLLVTTLDPGAQGWSSWSALQESVGQQLVAFAISFAVVAGYWWLNHTFVSSLRVLSPRIIGFVIVGLAFIVLLPFTTEGMALGGKVPTVVYAINVALVSLSATLLYAIAYRQDLYLVRPARSQFTRELWGSLITPAVFLASIPVAIFGSADVARWTWILLFPLNMVQGRADRRRAQRLGAADAGPRSDG